jgi:hypothetical protein
MVEMVRRVLLVLGVVLALVVVVPAAAVGPVPGHCAWRPELLPVPPTTFGGRVTAGDGAWLAGVTADPAEGLLWRDGRLVVQGRAFTLETELHAVNASGVAVGNVMGRDGLRHAVRRVSEYEYLPETAGSSVALDVNARGEAVGYDGGALVVWPPHGPARVLTMPPGAAPYGTPVIDEDGTVVARTGRVVDGVPRWQGYVWTPSGARKAFPADEVRDVRRGVVVGALGSPDVVVVAAGWQLGDGRPRVFAEGVTAVAVNRAGVVAGSGPSGEPLVWEGATPTRLPSPLGYADGAVAALNDHDAGGFVSPHDDLGTVPVRWTCR